MDAGLIWHRHGDRQAASAALTEAVAGAVQHRVAEQGAAALAMPGGSSPGLFFACLAEQELPWSRVIVTLTDERWVPPDDPASNERLVRQGLLQGGAANARMMGLYSPGCSLEEGAAQAQARLQSLPWPLAATVLGMGEDGHIASLFPGSAALAEGLKGPGESATLCLPVPDGLNWPRLTLTLAALLDCRLLALLVFGEDKRLILDSVAQTDAPARWPVAVAARTAARLGKPLQVFWAP
jgi:6-phosphogluconolactonase